MKNSIGWCNLTFNPVWGCKNKCPYCYARAFAKRFWKKMYKLEFEHYLKKYPFRVCSGDSLSGMREFKPTFLESQFDKKLPKKPQRIFVGSMSDIYYWDEVWIERVIEKVKEYPQHTFMFLTQDPDIYFGKYKFPLNCWLGTTVIGKPYINRMMRYTTEKAFNINKNNLKFISFEPLLGEVELNFKVDWVIIGAETGNRKGKVVPKREWIDKILFTCDSNKIPVYIKDNLSEYYDEYKGFQNFPTIKKL